MVKINNKCFCENCFEEINGSRCPHCGYEPTDGTYSPTLLRPGGVVSKRYTIGGVIGMGGFGVTYLAYDKKEDRRVAIKEYFPRETAHRESNSAEITVDDSETFNAGAEKFYREAEIVSSLRDNRNIVKIYDTIRANNTIYIVMEFLRGKTVREYRRSNGALDAPGAVYIAQSVLNALSAVHGANVLHRDISPDNVMLCGNGDVKLIDFGAARYRGTHPGFFRDSEIRLRAARTIPQENGAGRVVGYLLAWRDHILRSYGRYSRRPHAAL